MTQLVCSSPMFRQVLDRLAIGAQTVFLSLGRGERSGSSAWLCRAPAAGNDPSGAGGEMVAFRLSDQHGFAPDRTPLRETAQVELWPVSGGMQGRGRVRFLDGWTPISEISLVGSGMHRIALDASDTEGDALSELPANWRLRWARTLTATGTAAWQRTTRLHVGIVGCGRTGSIVASLLGRLGVRNLTLIDPDCVEAHNLGEMDVSDHACGWPKVQAISNRLTETLSSLPLRIRTVHGDLGEQAALQALRECDVIFSCVDDDRARLTLAAATSRRLQLLVDIGTGAGVGTIGVGADVRLFVPGERCMLCFGGLRNLDHALRSVVVDAAIHQRYARATRPTGAGSLASLNYVAAGTAVHLLQAVIAEQVLESTWVGIDGTAGVLSSRAVAAPRNGSIRCLCSSAGRGEITDDPWLIDDPMKGVR